MDLQRNGNSQNVAIHIDLSRNDRYPRPPIKLFSNEDSLLASQHREHSDGEGFYQSSLG